MMIISIDICHNAEFLLQSKPEVDDAMLEECKAQYESYLKLEDKLLQELGILGENKQDV